MDTVCVDFDGVISEHEHGWPPDKIGRPLEPGCNLLRDLHSKGYEVVILTARESHYHGLLMKWLIQHNLARYVERITSIKPPAIAYIDDKAVRWERNVGASIPEGGRLVRGLTVFDGGGIVRGSVGEVYAKEVAK